MHIPDEEEVYRTVFNFMEKPKAVFEELVFQFQDRDGKREESLIWSRFATTAKAIHALGIAKETSGREQGKNHTYIGYITGVAGIIRAINEEGHGFVLLYTPKEGKHHVSIKFQPDLPNKKDQHLRNRLKKLLRDSFSALTSQ